MPWPRSKLLEEMYALYLEGHSTRQVAAVFGVTGQSVHGLFKYNHKPMRAKPAPLAFVEFNDNRYTLRNTGYYGRTNKERSLLHRDMWEHHNGPIPNGWDVHHKDANKGNNVIENLECLPKADHTRLHAKAKKCGS